MTEAAAVDDGESLAFMFTGGEPFLDFDFLRELVTHGAGLGGKVSCVTNAYWAHTDAGTAEKLTVLRDAGLTALAVSVSRFHRLYVPLHRASRALRIARELGIRTELKGVVTKQEMAEHGMLEEWKNSLDADVIHIFPVLPSLREGGVLPEDEYYREPGIPSDPCPGEVLTIYYDGVARSCCFPAPTDQFLTIGHVGSQPLTDVIRQMRESTTQRILRERGPIHFANAAVAAGLGHRLRSSYAGVCDLCTHIREDAGLRRVAESVVQVESST
jgi:MoaA/NifB/PqqE/SkfB family radical SAM enzyme